ncbi:hypothetical protein IPA_02275 [Ignicoccus pacificus DSM 13166]|uniref:EamA domain-containing protein n=1 Tax=Ignicoccus pacificus DSM 13166 TaxID=940294 RepID=A0A977KBQ0_9CREN|nr:hypothetical protein IPA_02275 [Ignicoccus pacificus DSM 13166]
MRGTKGFLFSILSTFTASLTAVIAKALVSDLNPLLLNAVIYTSAFLLSFPYLFLKNSKPRFTSRTLLSGISLSLYGALLYYSFLTIKASVGGLAISIFPVITSILASLLYKERLGRREIIALALSASAIALVSSVSNPAGVLLALLSSLFLSIYTLLLKDSSVETVSSVLLGSSLASWIFVVMSGAPLNASSLLAVPLGALSILGTALWIEAVEAIGPSRASLGALSYPFFVLSLSILLLKESVVLSEIIAYSLAFLSLFLVLLR